jgi:putative transposase
VTRGCLKSSGGVARLHEVGAASDARVAAMAGRRRYPTDLSDAEWELAGPLVPAVKPAGRAPAAGDRRRAGLLAARGVRVAAAAARPAALADGLPLLARLAAGGPLGAGPGRAAGAGARAGGPRADAERGGRGQPERQDDRKGGVHGYDGGKKVNGRKRHLLVDTLGIVLKVHVTAASTGDRDGAAVLPAASARSSPG